jgi:hypothetical protein
MDAPRPSSGHFGFELEITARLGLSGARIWETGICYSGRTSAECKQIGWRDGVQPLWRIVRFSRVPAKSLLKGSA